MILTRLPAVVTALYRGVRRLKPKQGAGLFLIALLLIPSSLPLRAADPGPQAPTSSGGQVPTSSNAAVSGNTGTFTTGMEIDLPPGRVGMTPKLGMSYASGSGNGPLGVGWNIPMTNIVRVGPRKGVPGAAVDFSADEFYLNLNGGGGRLLPVEILDSTGNPIIEACTTGLNSRTLFAYNIVTNNNGQGLTNGNAGTNGNNPLVSNSTSYCVRRYHTEIESWLIAEAYFAQIPVAAGSPLVTSDPSKLLFWVITSKTGMRMVFKDMAILDTFAETDLANHAWYLTRCADTHGNTIDYQYTKGGLSAGYLYYKRIAYTGYIGTGGLDTSLADSEYSYFIHFALQPRRDFNVSFRAGYKQILGDLYAGVFITPSPVYAAGSTRLLTSYTIKYAQSFKTGRNLVDEIEHFGEFTPGGAAALKYPGSKYRYTGEDAAGTPQLPLGWQGENNSPFAQGEVFGRSDSAGTHDYGARLLDINGDGLPDKVDSLFNDSPYNQTTNTAYLNNGQQLGFYKNNFAPGANVSTHYNSGGQVNDNGVRYFDINGDGIADKIIHPDPNSSSVYLGTGSGFSAVRAAPIKATNGYPANVQILPTRDPLNPAPTPAANYCNPDIGCGGGGVDPFAQIISGPGSPSSPSTSLSSTFHFLYFGFNRCANSLKKSTGATYNPIPPPTGAPPNLLVYQNIPDGNYTFTLTCSVTLPRGGGTIEAADTALFAVQNMNIPLPVPRFTALPQEGFAEYLPFRWECTANCGATLIGRPKAALALGAGSFTGYQTALQFTTPPATGPAWLKVIADGVESIPIYWRFSAEFSPLGGIDGFSPPNGSLVPLPYDQGVRVADVNGDGMPDIVEAYEQGDKLGNNRFRVAHVYLQTASGYFVESADWTASLFATGAAFSEIRLDQSTAPAYISHDDGRELVDVNGDGLPDIVTSFTGDYGSALSINLNNGHGFNAAATATVNNAYGTTPWGATVPGCDFCQGGGTGTTTGGGTGTVTLYRFPVGYTSYGHYDNGRYFLQSNGSRFMDVNGDGLPDYIVNNASYANPAGYQAVFLNTGAGFRYAGNYSAANMPAAFTWYKNDGTAEAQGVQCDGVSGSGMLDCLDFHSYHSSSWLPPPYSHDRVNQIFSRNRDQVPDLLAKIENGFGGTTEIAYKPSTAYLHDLAGAEPVQSYMPIVTQVASELKVCDGRGQCYTTRHEYAGAQYDYHRHEVRGFRIVRSWEASTDPNQSPSYSDTYYRQDWPFVGMIDKAEAFSRAGQRLGASYLQFTSSQLPSLLPNVPRLLVEKTKDRMDTYEQQLPDAIGTTRPASDPYTRISTVATEYRYDSLGNVVMMHSLGLVEPAKETCPAPVAGTQYTCPFDWADQTSSDDVGTVTQYFIQGDERVPDGGGGYQYMTAGAWRVGMVKSSQSYQVPPTSGFDTAPADPTVAGALTATSFCYDGCANANAIGAGDITHSSVWLDKDDVDAGGNSRSGHRWLTTITAYNGYGQVNTITDLANNTTTYAYDDNLGHHTLLSRITNALGQHPDFTYNDAGLLSQETDLNGVLTVYQYDRLWRAKRVFKPSMDAVHPVVEYVYHFAPDFMGTNVTSQYVASRKLLDWNASATIESRSFFDGMMRSFAAVAPAPDPAAFAAGQGVWSLTFWNDQGLQVDAYRPFLAMFESAPPAQVPAGQPTTHVTYDLKKRPQQTDYPDGTRSITLTSAIAYAPSGNKLRPAAVAVDGKNHWVMHVADGAGRLVEVRENKAVNALSYGDYYSTRYAYDALGRLTGVTDPKGKDLVSGIVYDSLGRKLSITDADTQTTQNFYDDQGRLVQEKDGRNVVTSMQYDALGRAISKHFDTSAAPGVQGLTDASYQYDASIQCPGFAVGRLTQRSDSAGSESFCYDSIGEPIQATRQIAVGGVIYPFSLSRNYNALGQVKTLTYPDGYVLTNDFAANSVLTRVHGRMGTGPETVFATYDQFNEVGQMLHGGIMDGNVQRTFRYDFATGRPMQQSDDRLMSNGQLQNLIYFAGFNPNLPPILTYDEVGNLRFAISSQMQKDGTTRDTSQAFSYDALNRLSQATSVNTYGQLDFSYDEAGNITQKDGKAYAYDGAKLHAVTNRTIGATSEDYAYDAAGNMTAAPGLGVIWDAEGRPAAIMHTNKGVTLNYSYTYDDGGGRVLKQSTGHTDPGKNYTRIYLGNLYEVQVEPGFGGVPVFTHTKHIFAGTQRISTITETASAVNFSAALSFQSHNQAANAIQMALAQNGGSGLGAGGWVSGIAAAFAHFDTHHPFASATAIIHCIRSWGHSAFSWTKAQAALQYHHGAIQYAQHAAEFNALFTLLMAFVLLGGLMVLVKRNARRALMALACSREHRALSVGHRTRLTLLPLPRWAYTPIGYATLIGFVIQLVAITGVGIPTYAQAAALNAASTPAGLPIGTFYYLTNHLGSSTVILDDLANVVESNAYKPFGELWDDGSGASKDHRFYFTGAEKEEFDLYQFGARWYSPDLGRFISADSMVPDPKDSQQLNRYTYVGNNPINLTDPTGHFWNIVIGAVIGAVSAAASGGDWKAIVQGAIIGALSAWVGGAAYGAGYEAGGTSTAMLSQASASGVYSAGLAAMSDHNAGQAALIAFAGSFAGAGLGIHGVNAGWSAATQQAVAVGGGMVIAGASAATTGGDVAGAIGAAFAASMLNMGASAIDKATKNCSTCIPADGDPGTAQAITPGYRPAAHSPFAKGVKDVSIELIDPNGDVSATRRQGIISRLVNNLKTTYHLNSVTASFVKAPTGGASVELTFVNDNIGGDAGGRMGYLGEIKDAEGTNHIVVDHKGQLSIPVIEHQLDVAVGKRVSELTLGEIENAFSWAAAHEFGHWYFQWGHGGYMPDPFMGGLLAPGFSRGFTQDIASPSGKMAWMIPTF